MDAVNTRRTDAERDQAIDEILRLMDLEIKPNILTLHVMQTFGISRSQANRDIAIARDIASSPGYIRTVSPVDLSIRDSVLNILQVLLLREIGSETSQVDHVVKLSREIRENLKCGGRHHYDIRA